MGAARTTRRRGGGADWMDRDEDDRANPVAPLPRAASPPPAPRPARLLRECAAVMAAGRTRTRRRAPARVQRGRDGTANALDNYDPASRNAPANQNRRRL